MKKLVHGSTEAQFPIRKKNLSDIHFAVTTTLLLLLHFLYVFSAIYQVETIDQYTGIYCMQSLYQINNSNKMIQDSSIKALN